MTNLELTDEEFSLVVWAVNCTFDELEDRDMKSLTTLVNKLTEELKRNIGESHASREEQLQLQLRMLNFLL